MNRQLCNAMAAQYATPEVSGDGLVSWENGKKCVIPSVKLYGAAVQDGTPTPDAPVMPVCNNGTFVARGRNLADLYGYSAQSMSSTSASRVLTNTRGTAISTTDPEKSVQVTQSQIGAPDTPESSTNGYFCVGVNHNFQDGDIVTISFDLKITENPLGAATMLVMMNGSNSVGFSAVNGRCSVQRSWINSSTKKYIEIRNCGCSAIFSNFQIEYGDTATPYTPYYNGGQAQAPELWAIPGTDYRDEWNPQTGEGVRRCAVIDSYAGEAIDTPYISSTGALTDGAMVVYAIPDTPISTAPAKLTMPTGYGQIIQTGGDIPDCPITAKYLTHS